MKVLIKQPFYLDNIKQLLTYKTYPPLIFIKYKNVEKQLHNSFFNTNYDNFIWYIKELNDEYPDFCLCFVYNTLYDDIEKYSRV